MNFNDNDLWRDKTKLLNLRFSKLHSAKVLLKLKFDTEDQVLLFVGNGVGSIIVDHSGTSLLKLQMDQKNKSDI